MLVLGGATSLALLAPLVPTAAPAAARGVRMGRGAVLIADLTAVTDSVTNACLVAAGTCTPDISPFEPHLFEGFSTLGGDMGWTMAVAGFGLAGAYLTQGTEAFSVEEDETWLDDDLTRRRPQSLLSRDRADGLGGDDPFM